LGLTIPDTAAALGFRQRHVFAAQLHADAAIENLAREMIGGRGNGGIAAGTDDVEAERGSLLAHIGNGTVGIRIVLAERPEPLLRPSIHSGKTERAQRRGGSTHDVGEIEAHADLVAAGRQRDGIRRPQQARASNAGEGRHKGCQQKTPHA